MAVKFEQKWPKCWNSYIVEARVFYSEINWQLSINIIEFFSKLNRFLSYQKFPSKITVILSHNLPNCHVRADFESLRDFPMLISAISPFTITAGLLFAHAHKHFRRATFFLLKPLFFRFNHNKHKAMVRACCVVQCTNRDDSKGKEKGLHFFRYVYDIFLLIFLKMTDEANLLCTWCIGAYYMSLALISLI